MKSFLQILLFVPGLLFAQKQTVSHLYALDFELENDTFYLNDISFLSSFNEVGYNGHFDINEDNIVIYCANANLSNPNATELVRLDLEEESLSVLTNNNRMDDYPSFIGRSSYIHTQSLFDESILAIRSISNAVRAERILSNLSNIRSAITLDNDVFILNLESDLDYLAVAYDSDESFKILEANVGTRIVKFTDSQFFYVHKVRPENWILKRYDLQYLKKKSVVEMPTDCDEFDLLPDGSFITAKGSKILRYNPLLSENWEVIEDLSTFGINQISQIVVGNGKIVISNTP